MTSVTPHGDIFFEMEFDFIDHNLEITCTLWYVGERKLEPKSVATFYHETMAALRDLGIGCVSGNAGDTRSDTRSIRMSSMRRTILST